MLPVASSSELLKSAPPGTVLPFLDAALRYADLGYPVFPCVPGGKEPFTEHGLKDASTDAEQIERWSSEKPNANIAIRTEGLLILDIDGEGNRWLNDQEERWHDLAAAPSSQTSNGGRHFWFRQPAGKGWRCTQGRLADHVDTRADGGYIVAPPSSVDGRSYRWLENYELDVPSNQLPPPPAWLVEELDRSATKPLSTWYASDQNNKIPEGRRNGVLTS